MNTMRDLPHLMRRGFVRIGRIEAETQRILGGLAARGEAQLGMLLARARKNDLALRAIALRQEAERRGTEAFARLEALGGHALERIGLASHRDVDALAGQIRILAARVDRLSRRERQGWDSEPLLRPQNVANGAATGN